MPENCDPVTVIVPAVTNEEARFKGELPLPVPEN